jgi:cation:H+ antiporter
MFIPLFVLIVGFILLIKGADFLVDGASSFAKRFGVSDLMIGLTIVAFGTSAPELVVTLQSALNGTTDIAIGNILGSNIANILLILGVCALVRPLLVQRTTTWKEIPFSLLGAIMLLVLVNDAYFTSGMANTISRADGIVFLGFFVIFLYYVFGSAKDTTSEASGEDVETTKLRPLPVAGGLVLGGLALLVLGGKWVVESAVTLATLWGMSEAVIGLTVVAVGTSLPELATSLVAVKKGKVDIAIGNVVGSNIFNIFWVLGFTALFVPLPFTVSSNMDVYMVLISSALLFTWMFVGTKHVLQRWQGIVFLVLYVSYIAYLVF